MSTARASSVFLSSYRNTSGSLGEREMLWEHEPQASVSTAFLSSPKLLRVCKFSLLAPSLRQQRVLVPFFYRVIETRVEVWENEKCCENTSRRRVFPQLF